jgi:hypothetical protein
VSEWVWKWCKDRYVIFYECWVKYVKTLCPGQMDFKGASFAGRAFN